MQRYLYTALFIVAVGAGIGLGFHDARAKEARNPGSTALDGNCPVCLVEMNKQVKGSPEFESRYDGKSYLFPGQKQKDMFVANPEKYIPAFNGNCTVCHVESGKAGPGRAEYFSIHEDRLFLFPNTKVKRMFDDNPDRYAHVGIGLGGYCPVCLHNGKKVMGKMEYRATYDGITYLFPSEKARQAFVAEPGKYTPVMNGDCTVCQKEMGKSVPGNVDYSLVHDGRLYVFPGEKQLEMFEKNPAKYADADRALDGYCPVCVGEMNKLVRGDAKFSAMHNGKQYLFPGEDQFRMFNANPAVYTGKTIDDRFEKLVKQKSQSRASSKDSGQHCTAGCCGCGG